MKHVFASMALLASALLVSAPSAQACLGGHLISLDSHGETLAQINMVESTVTAVGGARILGIFVSNLSVGGVTRACAANTPEQACGDVVNLESTIPGGLLNAPVQLNLTVQSANGALKRFTVKDFYQTRGGGGCGRQVEGQ